MTPRFVVCQPRGRTSEILQALCSERDNKLERQACRVTEIWKQSHPCPHGAVLTHHGWQDVQVWDTAGGQGRRYRLGTDQKQFLWETKGFIGDPTPAVPTLRCAQCRIRGRKAHAPVQPMHADSPAQRWTAENLLQSPETTLEQGTWEALGGGRSGVTRMRCRILKIRIATEYVWMHEHPIANQSNCHPHPELAVTSHLHPWLEH